MEHLESVGEMWLANVHAWPKKHARAPAVEKRHSFASQQSFGLIPRQDLTLHIYYIRSILLLVRNFPRKLLS